MAFDADWMSKFGVPLADGSLRTMSRHVYFGRMGGIEVQKDLCDQWLDMALSGPNAGEPGEVLYSCHGVPY